MNIQDIRRKTVIVVSLWLALVLLKQVPGWESVEYLEYDVLSVASTPERADFPIVIVGIDDASFGNLQMQWPWPRSIHAKLIDKLTEQGAAVIAFDVVFSEPSRHEEDTALARATRNSNKVVMAADIIFQQNEYFEQLFPVEPLKDFIDAGANIGIATVTPDNDQTIRRIPGYDDAFWKQVVRKYQENIQSTLQPTLSFAEHARLRYTGPDHSYYFVSYYQALEADKKLPPGLFKDKIVIIGYDAKSLPELQQAGADTFPTPYTRVTGWLSPGVEIQANFISNSLMNRAIHRLPDMYSLTLIAVVLVMAVVMMKNWRPLTSAITASILSIIIMFTGYLLFKYIDIWLLSSLAVVAPFSVYIVQGGIAFVYERQKQRQIRKAFEFYVSPEIVREMLIDPDKLVLGGARKKLTLLFTDLAGFTSTSETMEPEDVAELLNRHMTDMSNIIIRNGGTIDKYIGDAIMAFWGAPLDDDAQAEHAFMSACEMQEKMTELRLELANVGFPEIHMRVGINTGMAVVGNMGATDRFDYTAIGDAVNLASRLEGINKLYGTGILISESTINEIADKSQVMHIDKVRVKGKEEAINVYTLAVSPELTNRVGEAIHHYQNREWDKASELWQVIKHTGSINKIAELYLARIKSFKLVEPESGWDGSVALDKM